MANDAELLHPVLLHHIVNSLQWQGLRPMQEAAVRPLIGGSDALVLAPTAGGKTEAALFPLLSRMEHEQWSGTSVLYVCPLKALLNNLLPRIEAYTGWLGRRAALWHGDVSTARRRTIVRERPDVLLTTPESLESMLVSATVDHDEFFRGVRAVVVDEVHAFAGDDRGWHLLAVLERLSQVAGRPIQRVGLSATVGNPDTLLAWLQGSVRHRAPGQVVAPAPSPAPGGRPSGEVEVDYVGSVHNAAKVLAALHRGEKRLVFCESRALVEELGQRLRGFGVTTFLSHASLSVDERRRAEEAFAQERDCVIVATSTLELGIDVGDLDRVVQIGAPRTVAAFLQRIGRTGRRPGTTRNCLFLALDGDGLLQATALLHLWSQGWVEEVVPPPEPRHIVAQQMLALALQKHRVGDRLWRHEWNDLAPFDSGAEPIVQHLVDNGYLDSDSGLLFIGPEAERRYGRRHFTDMLAVFTAPPQFTVMSGRTEIGRSDPALLTSRVEGPRLLLLGGRSWRVTHIDWRRHRCFVEPADGGGRALWMTGGTPTGRSYRMVRAMREVLLGADPPVAMTGRATDRLTGLREEHTALVHPGGTLVVQDRHGEARWWTWAGYRANATLVSTLSELADPTQRPDDASIRLRAGLTREELLAGIDGAAGRLCLPFVDDLAVTGLKFSAALPHRLAVATLASRLADLPGAEAALAEPVRVTHFL